MRASESTITAMASTAPVIMKRSDDERFSSVSPLEMDWMTMMPSSAEYALPRPPNRLVPPMTAAAIALRLTSPVPACWLDEASRAAASTPPIAASSEHSMNAEV